MSLAGVIHIDCLSRDNYDTWKLQMKALLSLNGVWGYINGDTAPENTDAAEWARNDTKAMSSMILSIGTSELKQVKHCQTSRELWLKLEGIYQSRGPARKAALMVKLFSCRMEEGADLRAHLNDFSDAVDELADMEIKINTELLSVMLLNSLPDSFENFR